MCNCAGANGRFFRDQTRREHIETVNRKREDARTARGSGLFLVPDPEAGIREFKKIVIEDITYKECVLRGGTCSAFKWIPYAAIEKEKVRELVVTCAGGFCMDIDLRGNSIDCEVGCNCFIQSFETFGVCH